MGADKSAEYPKFPKMYLPKLSAQAQKFGILMKNKLHWASVVHDFKSFTILLSTTSYQVGTLCYLCKGMPTIIRNNKLKYQSK